MASLDKKNEDSDRVLMLAVAKGDESAFERLLANYLKDVHRICQRLMRHNADAEDAAQDAFCKIWRQAWRFDPAKGSLRTWVLSVTSRACLDRLRRQKRFESRPGRVDIEDWADRLKSNDNDAEAELQIKQTGQSLLRALDQLKPEIRLVLILTYLEGYNQAQVATITGIGLKAFEGRLARAKRELKKRLQKDDI